MCTSNWILNLSAIHCGFSSLLASLDSLQTIFRSAHVYRSLIMYTRHSLVSILDMGPIDACIQLSSQLPRMTVQELHVELPYVIRRIFGFGRFDWSLRDIGSDRGHLFSIIQEFLSPWHGELWKALIRLQDHSPSLLFQYNISDLPLHLRAKLASLYLPDIVRGRTTTTTGQHLTSLSLDPFEYFLFNLLSYVISDQQTSVKKKREFFRTNFFIRRIDPCVVIRCI